MNTRTYLANLRIAMVEELDKLPKHFCQPKVCLTATEPSICVTYLLQFGRHPAQGYVDECGLMLFLKNGAKNFDLGPWQFKSDASASVVTMLICQADQYLNPNPGR
jgi:hypothetical protein